MDWVTDAHPVLLVATVAALYLTTAISGVLPVVYHWQTSGRWADNPVGRHLMSVSVCLFVMLAFTAFSPLIREVNVLLVVSLVLYATLATLQVNQMRLIIRAQHRRAEQEDADDDDRDLPEPP